MSSTTPVAPPGVFPPPPGVTPNFANPPQHTLGLIPLIIIFTTLSTIVLALRLFTKVHILRRLGWEDVIIVVAWMCNVALMGLYLKGLQLGAGSHIWNFKMEDFPLYAKLANAAILLYSPLVGLPKVSILLFYLRLSPSTAFRFSTIGVIVLVWVYIVAILLVQLFACNPVKKLWEPLIEGTCINQRPIYLTIPITGTVLDLMVLLLPIPMLMRLQVNIRTKLTVVGIFAICSCTCVVSALRIWSTSKLLDTTDLTWDAAISNCLTVVEVNMMIVCGSVLVLLPFCRRYLPFLLGSDRNKPAREMLGASGMFVHASPNFDGPMGPRSKSHYRIKVSSSGNANRSRGGRRTLWGISFGSSTLMEDEDDDLESLSAELRRLPPTAAGMGGADAAQRNTYDDKSGADTRQRAGDDAANAPAAPINASEIGQAKSDFADLPADTDNGIVKTVSLEVRDRRI